MSGVCKIVANVNGPERKEEKVLSVGERKEEKKRTSGISENNIETGLGKSALFSIHRCHSHRNPFWMFRIKWTRKELHVVARFDPCLWDLR